MPDAFNIYRQCLLPGRPPWYTLFALQRTLRYLLPNELLAPAAGRGSLIPHFVGGLYTLCLQEHQGATVVWIHVRCMWFFEGANNPYVMRAVKEIKPQENDTWLPHWKQSFNRARD
jgi:hypothetical protein